MKDIKIIFSIDSIRMFILIMVLIVLGSLATPQISKAQGSQGTFYALTCSPVPIDSNKGKILIRSLSGYLS